MFCFWVRAAFDVGGCPTRRKESACQSLSGGSLLRLCANLVICRRRLRLGGQKGLLRHSFQCGQEPGQGPHQVRLQRYALKEGGSVSFRALPASNKTVVAWCCTEHCADGCTDGASAWHLHALPVSASHASVTFPACLPPCPCAWCMLTPIGQSRCTSAECCENRQRPNADMCGLARKAVPVRRAGTCGTAARATRGPSPSPPTPQWRAPSPAAAPPSATETDTSSWWTSECP